MTFYRYRKLKISARDLLAACIGSAAAIVAVYLLHVINTKIPVSYPQKPFSIQWLPSTVKRWSPVVNSESKKYNIDPNLVSIIMAIESAGNPKAQSSAGAVGLMQVTPPTANDIARKYLKKPVDSFNLQDPKTNIEFGVAYIAYLRDLFGDTSHGDDWDYSVELIAAGYNGGPGAAASLKDGRGLLDTQTVVYSRDVYNMWRERRISDSPTFDRWLERGGQDLVTAAVNS